MGNSFKTFLKHTAKDFHNQSVNPPVVRASTIIFKSMQDIKKTQNKYLKDPVSGNFDYGRQGTSTTYALQQILRKIEECYKVYLTPTGFGAIFLGVLSVVKPDDEILVTDSVYSPSRLLTETYLKIFNIRAIFYNPNDFNDLKNKITKKTKLIFCCKRGGNRSLSFHTVCEKIGWKCEVISGGYRSYRQFVIEMLEKLARRNEFIIISGRTGNGKPKLLTSNAAPSAGPCCGESCRANQYLGVRISNPVTSLIYVKG